MTNGVFAALEAGGTKMICALTDHQGKVLAQSQFPTSDPETVFNALAAFYNEQTALYGPIRGGGVASFGPLDLDPRSPGYGGLTMTPKPGWSSVAILDRFAALVAAPVRIDTDVNCAALAELCYGAGRGLDRICYVTVGTGIGVGVIDSKGGQATVSHPEMGHIRVPLAPGDEFAGACPSHGDCLEGLASGAAINARWARGAETLSPDHAAWDFEAHYIAALCINLTYVLRPQRIVIGGGVTGQPRLYPKIRADFERMAAGYALDRYSADSGNYICEPALTDPPPGLVGAIELARGTATMTPPAHG